MSSFSAGKVCIVAYDCSVIHKERTLNESGVFSAFVLHALKKGGGSQNWKSRFLMNWKALSHRRE